MNTSPLPVKREPSQLYILSLLVGLLMTLASLAGIFFQSFLYPVEELRRSFVTNDVVNLLIGLPVLIGSMWFARRGRLIGLLFWPGALLYIIYNYIAYTLAMSQTILFLPSLCLVVLSIYTMIRILLGMDTISIQNLLKGLVPERFAGGVLIGFGVLFFLRSIGQVAGILTGQISVEGAELGVLIADLLTTPAWVIGGILLWRKQPHGYATGAGLLFQASMLFVGLLVFFILQPLMVPVSFPVSDFAVIFVMGLICFIPSGLFIRGVLSK